MTSTRETLMDAGLRLIAEHGVRSVSVGAIEAEAGFVPRGGTLYKHFRSKEHLVTEALQRHIDSLAALDGIAGLLPLDDRRSELQVIGRWVLQRLAAEQLISSVIEKDGQRMPDLVERLRVGVSEPGYGLLANYLQARGLPPEADAEALAVLLLGSLVNLRRSAWTFGRAPGDVSDERAVATWVDLCEAVLQPGTTTQ